MWGLRSPTPRGRTESCTLRILRMLLQVLTGRLWRMSQSVTGGIGVPINDGDTPNPANAPEPAGLGNPQGRQARNPQRAPRA